MEGREAPGGRPSATATIYVESLGKEPFLDASMKLRAEGRVGRQNVKIVARLAEGKCDYGNWCVHFHFIH